MRPFVMDPYWTRSYVPETDEKAPARMSLDALGKLLDAAAFGGTSAYADIFFNVDRREH